MNETTPEQYRALLPALWPTTPADAWHERALRCFGAVPVREAPSGTVAGLGRLAGTRTLVVVHRRDAPVHVAALLDALHWRDTLPGPLDHVVVLGECFSATVHDDLQGLNDAGITLLRVVSAGTRPVRFAPLRRLLLYPVVRQPLWWKAGDGGRPNERLTVALKDYVEVAGPGGAAAGLSRSLGLSQLSGWQVDPQYDGSTFRPVWHSGPGSALSPPTFAVQLEMPWQPGERQVCVRATDAQGAETQVMLVAPLA